jgi:hypothetical protein
MKLILMTVYILISFSTWADMPVLATDIDQDQKIINLSYSDLSLTQDFDNGRDTEVLDTNVGVKSIEVILSGSSNNKTIPILSIGVSKASSGDGSTSLKSYGVYAGFALEGDTKKKLILFKYETSSESTIQDSLGLMAIFRSSTSSHSKAEYEVATSLELKEGIEGLSGGHTAGLSLNSKLPLSNQVHLVSRVGLSVESDRNYSAGAYRSAGPSLTADLGLSIQPKSNIEVEVGLGSYLQNFEYYQSDGRYVLSEARTGIGFIVNLNIAL